MLYTERADLPYSHKVFNSQKRALDDIIQPDFLASHEYFVTFRKGATSPEKMLVLAILEDAVTNFKKHLGAKTAEKQDVFNEAEGWIFRGDPDWFFSFVNICGMLGFNPDCIRKGLIAWKEKVVAEKTMRKYCNTKTRASPRHK